MADLSINLLDNVVTRDVVSMTYVAASLKTNTNSFGGLITDGNRVAATGVLGNQMYSRDATGTPLNSPLTVNTTATLTVPVNAVSVTICSVSNAVQVSEDSTQTAYFSLPAATPFTFDCARQSLIYLKTGSSTVVSFQFKLL
jgi:hypothetical protein